MSIVHEPQTREEIQKEFDTLLRTHDARASQISTKAEEAERRKHRELVDRAAEYTVESIVNGLARLQLGFGRAVDDIAAQLDSESSKLGELRRAIVVERSRLEQLEGTVVAAEALALLEQDRRQARAKLEQEAAEAGQALADEQVAVREGWARDQQELARATAEYTKQQAKERQLAREGYEYEQARQLEIEADQRALKQREVERQLADEEAVKVKDWTAREARLDDAAEPIERLRAEVSGFAEALEQATKAAREQAIASIHRETKVEIELLDKQHRSDVEVYALKVQTLEEQIVRQGVLVEELSTKLDGTIAKSQNLAEQAFQRPRA